METLKAAVRIHEDETIMVNVTHWPEYCKYFLEYGTLKPAQSECVKVPCALHACEVFA